MDGRLTFAIASMLIAASTPAFPQQASQAIPATNPATWFEDAYPPIALRYLQFGKTGFSVNVSPDGLPVDCEIIKSSGFSALDKGTCQAVMQRARFIPTGMLGGMSVFSSRMNWRLPDGLGPTSEDVIGGTTPAAISYVFTVERDGSVSDCRPESRVNELPSEHFCELTQKMVPITDDSGRAIKARVTYQRLLKIEQIK